MFLQTPIIPWWGGKAPRQEQDSQPPLLHRFAEKPDTKCHSLVVGIMAGGENLTWHKTGFTESTTMQHPTRDRKISDVLPEKILARTQPSFTGSTLTQLPTRLPPSILPICPRDATLTPTFPKSSGKRKEEKKQNKESHRVVRFRQRVLYHHHLALRRQEGRQTNNPPPLTDIVQAQHSKEMVLGLLILTAIPTTIGVAQGITQDRRQRDAEAAAKAAGLPTYFSLYTSSNIRELDSKDITIRDGKVLPPPPSPPINTVLNIPFCCLSSSTSVAKTTLSPGICVTCWAPRLGPW